ncbi:hypothetical protein SADUNF_Sadunf01G0160400 [Salix dunnii]|uniref:Uncharacterized protein n=1 Tax=Salix dunnii TaxID=1413687 RepID=A0A835NC34_9ROSI|nr:hypothetical protein SADUNF_Sadunf01G0160400 [Salix dunnii]
MVAHNDIRAMTIKEETTVMGATMKLLGKHCHLAKLHQEDSFSVEGLQMESGQKPIERSAVVQENREEKES